MNGRTHITYGFNLVLLFVAFLYYIAYKSAIYDAPAILAFVVGGMFGTLFSDFDIHWGGIKSHRNTLTHSALFSLVGTIAYAWTPDVFARSLLMFISFGMMTHLLFDLFEGDVEGMTFITRWARRINIFLHGKVGGSFKGPGSKWANKHERAYLLLHAGICLVCTLVLFWGIINGIDIDGWIF